MGGPGRIPGCTGALLAAAIVALTATGSGGSPARAAAPAPVTEPARGVFLVADESMPDPRFHGAVILLLDHSPRGSHGLIVNRPLRASVADVVPGLAAFGGGLYPVHFGGPVGLDQIVYLVRKEDGGAQKLEPVIDGVLVGSDPRSLQELMPRLDPSSLRVVLGYAGWAPGQLAAELGRNDWQLVRATEDDVFTGEPARLWERLYSKRDLLVHSRASPPPPGPVPGDSGFARCCNAPGPPPVHRPAGLHQPAS